MPRQLFKSLEDAMEFHKNPEQAQAMAKYMKNHFSFLGIKQPLRKELSGEFLKSTKKLNGSEIILLAEDLWNLPHREFQYIAMEMLYGARKKWDPAFHKLFLKLVTKKSWWDSVDFIATRLIGTYLASDPKPAIMITWSKASNLWQNRTAILFQLNYKQKTDKDLLFDTIMATKEKKDFFIQKAIGWSLRQLYKTDPEAVIEMVERSGINGLAKKEALKNTRP